MSLLKGRGRQNMDLVRTVEYGCLSQKQTEVSLDK
jgi:hypothetical protein